MAIRNFILIFCVFIVSFLGKAQSFPEIDKKIVFTKADFSAIDKLIKDGLPNQAIVQLLVLQKQALEENNICNYHEVITRIIQSTRFSGMESTELQKLFFKQHEIFNSLKGPIKNIAAFDLSIWFESLQYTNAFQFDDESLLWTINGESVKLKNFNPTPILQSYHTEYLKGDKLLMAIASNQIFNSEDTKHKPTLYDILANKYISVYGQSEYTDTCDWENTLEFSQKDLSSVKRVYANLEQLHKENERWDTYAYWLERRLTSCNSDSRTDENLLAVYYKFQQELAGFPASNRFAFRRAEIYAAIGSNWDWKSKDTSMQGFVMARQIIDQALTTYPISDFDVDLKELRKQIVSQNLDISFENEIRPSEFNFMNVKYRNVSKAQLLIFKVTKRTFTNEYSENPFAGLTLKQIGKKELSLPEDGKHHFHSKDFIVNELSEPGQYLVAVASSVQDWENALKAEKWEDIKNVAYQVLNLSNLTMRKSSEDDGVRIFINNVQTGKPIKNAKVKVLGFRNNAVENLEYTTDKNGSVKLLIERRLKISVYHNNDSLSDNIYFYPRSQSDKRYCRVFTDRRIYRPGQSIYYKTIHYNQSNAVPASEFGQPVLIEFKDGNEKVLYQNQQVTNDYGSTNGSFVLPKSGFPLGTLNVFLDGKYAESIQVEEYKRPTFQVSFETPKKKISLGETVEIQGKVSAFAGYPITNAEVEINVSEYRYFPRWCVVIDSDRRYDTTFLVKTDDKGIFKIEFNPKNPKETNGVFYSFDALVLDLTGETQSTNYSMYVGKSAYSISANVQSKYRSDQLGLIEVNVKNSQNVNQEGKVIHFEVMTKENKNWYRFEREESEFQDFTKTNLKNWLPDWSYYQSDKKQKYSSIQKGSLISGAKLVLEDFLTESAGEYKISFSTVDELGDTVSSSYDFIVWNPENPKNQHQEEFWVESMNSNPKVGDEVELIVGTSHKKARLLLAEYGEQGLISAKYKKIRKRKSIYIDLEDELKNGVVLFTGIVKSGKISDQMTRLTPIDSSRILNMKLKHIQEPLRPGSEQKWEIEITNEGKSVENAEVLTSMYDASLDQLADHNWKTNLFPSTSIITSWSRTYSSVVMSQQSFWDQNYFGGSGYFPLTDEFNFAPGVLKYDTARLPVQMRQDIMEFADEGELDSHQMKLETKKVTNNIRENFNETAFFIPQLHANADGNYKWSFTLPDALTKWKMMALAHTKDIRNTYFTQSFEARKELMLETFEPRFWRKGDSLAWVGKVTNLSEKEQLVDVKLKFMNPMTEEDISSQFGDFQSQQITLSPNESKAVEWVFFVPENAPILVNFEAEAKTMDFSDIIRKPTPILNGRETITMAENFTYDEKGNYELKLRDFDKISKEAELISFGIQVQPQPIWSTLLSLAQLLEPQNELTEGYFTQYFSTKLAQKILNENPDMKRALQTWKLADEDALTSALNQNDELKALLLSETVWVINAENETQQLRRLGQLLDDANLNAVSTSSWDKLKDLQLSNGTWSWVGKERTSWHITQYIANGLAWLKESQITVDEETFAKTIIALSLNYQDQFNKLTEADREKGLGLHTSIIQWLYIRSFTDAKEDSASKYYASLILKNWKDYSLSTQAIMGLWALKKGDIEFSSKLKSSVMDRARRDSVLGTYWLENLCGYGWYDNNIETQATLIEFLAKAGQSPLDVQAMQMWLLQQKRTQLWDSPKSTAMACYALQKFGNFNAETKAQTVKLKIQNEADVDIPNEKVSYSHQPKMQNWSTVKAAAVLEITESSPVFASMQLTYSDKSSNIQKTTGDFRVERNYYLLIKGKEVAINENYLLETGDVLRIKIKLVSNRNLDFVYVEDPKASGWEPMNTVSGYQYTDGMYYLSNRDNKTEFFVENLNKGTHNYVYDIKVTAKGNFNVGPSKAMCYYAPTFVANTQGKVFKVK